MNAGLSRWVSDHVWYAACDSSRELLGAQCRFDVCSLVYIKRLTSHYVEYVLVCARGNGLLVPIWLIVSSATKRSRLL